MQSVQFIYRQEDETRLGFLQEFPDYWTQGESLDELKDYLRDLYADLSGGPVRSS